MKALYTATGKYDQKFCAVNEVYNLYFGGMESSCEHGNEPLGSIKCWETIKWLHRWWPLE
jgi:hypothetical protein